MLFRSTAYLNYLATNSTDILTEYFDFKHSQYDRSGEIGNVEMLQYIRYNVRSNFDMVFENAIPQFFSAVDYESYGTQWHQIIKNADFQCDYMREEYCAYAPTKAWRIYYLENEIYPYLPE